MPKTPQHNDPSELDKRGILDQSTMATRFNLKRFSPAGNLADVVDCYWCTRWNLKADSPAPQQAVLAHPCVQLVIEENRSGVFGIATARFERKLAEQGRAFGIKFLPGAFRNLINYPVSDLTDRRVGLKDCFGAEALRYETEVLATDDDDRLQQLADQFVSGLHPQPDDSAVQARQAVERIRQDSEITKVDQLATILQIGKRQLQRLFADYVGVPPKWVIQRYRLHEVIERLETGTDVDLTALAVELNYFDQSHFVRDFEQMVGRSPSAYLANRQRDS